MKFKHAYAVGQVSDKAVELLDPHGEVIVNDSGEALYNPDLILLISELSELLIVLEEELKSFDYERFSIETRDKVDGVISLLKNKKKVAKRGGKNAIEELRKHWLRLNSKNKLEEENGQLLGLRSKTAKNLIEELLKKEKALFEEDIGRGFEVLVSGYKIKGQQKMDYSVLKSYFESVRINKFI
jgi:hypothetical protein